MKRITLFATLTVLALASLVTMGGAQDFAFQNPSKVAGRAIATSYGNWRVRALNSVAAGAASITLDRCYIPAGSDNRQIFPFATNVAVIVIDGANTETVTPSSVTTPTAGAPSSVNPLNCAFTATFANAHSIGVPIVSGDAGLWEAINDLGNGTGGVVMVTPDWGAATSLITAGTGGFASVNVLDDRNGNMTTYAWTGSAYVVTSEQLITANGGRMVPFFFSALVTLSTSGQTTDTAANVLPANSYILGVTGRVATTITAACTGWELGDPTTAARFTTNDTTLTAGETKVGSVMATTGIASATTGMFQTTAAKVRITCAGGNPGAGVIRVETFGFTIVAAGS